MKKVLSLIVAIVMVAVMSVSVFAAGFVDSIEAKSAPKIIVVKDGDKTYGAVIIDSKTEETKEGVPIYDEESEVPILEFFVISAAEKSQAILQIITEKLTDAEKQIKNAANVGKLSEGLDKEIEKEINEFYGSSKDKIKVSDLVVSDLFDASLVRDKESLEQIKEGQKVRFIIKPSFSENDFFVVLNNPEGKNWEVVKDVEWTEDGNLVITSDNTSVFAIAVEKSADLPVDPHGPNAPQTNNRDNFVFLYVAIAVLCIGAAVFFFVKSKKKSKN